MFGERGVPGGRFVRAVGGGRNLQQCGRKKACKCPSVVLLMLASGHVMATKLKRILANMCTFVMQGVGKYGGAQTTAVGAFKRKTNRPKYKEN